MAKARSRAVTVYQPPRQSAPIIRVNVPRARSAPKPKRHHRRRSGGGGGGGNLQDRMTKVAIGGAVLGYVEKSGMASSLPTLPFLGRKGSIALAAYYMGGQKPGLLQDVAIAAAVLAGYELGHDGKISGDED